MKIRNGFVSNSSTTSFCIYGLSVDEINDELENKAYDVGLECFFSPFDNDGWIGNSFTSMDKNETRKKFESRTEKALSKLGLNAHDAEVIEEAWRDG